MTKAAINAIENETIIIFATVAASENSPIKMSRLIKYR